MTEQRRRAFVTGRGRRDVPTPAKAPTAAAPTTPKFLRRGKVKEVFEVSPKELEFRFTDDISVFDKHIPSEIPHKGETLNRTAAHWFEVCGRLGIPHHYLSRSGPTSMRVKRVQVVPKPKTLGPHPKNYLVPLEFIVRYYVAGSLWDRVKAGSVKGESKVALAKAAESAMKDSTDEVDEESVSKESQKVVKDYFETMQKE